MRVKKGFKRLITLAIALSMTLVLCLPALAAGTQDSQFNAAVEEDKSGVLQVVTGVKDKDSGKFIPVVSGTGFLVNDQNMATCYHVVNFDYSDPEISKYIKEDLGLTEKQADERKVIKISVYRDQTITATIVTQSADADLAVLKLEQPLQNRTYLKINTEEVKTTAPCYTLGFPGMVGAMIDKNTYTSEDVAVNFGMINRTGSDQTINKIVHTAQLPQGCSGGPLVDYAGNVIGITQKTTEEETTNAVLMSAISVTELVSMMSPLGIEYTEASAPDPGPGPDTDTNQEIVTVNKDALQTEISNNATPPETEGKPEDVVTEYNDAVKNAQEVMAKADAEQGEVDSATKRLADAKTKLENAEPEPAKTTIPLPAIIAIIAAVIILIIVIVLLKPGKKQEPVYAPGPDFGPGATTASAGGGAGYGFDNYAGKPEAGTTVLSGGAADTTVLGGDSNATTVLGGAGANFGSLTRVKTNERVTINKDQFKIGRERSRVDYCISDNPAVGRLHAIIVNRGGSTYVVDQNSTNCTFVNSVRATANQEVRLNSGDKITFADEEFTYNAF
ncbi:MAG: trypsin-like peptidase domain-containing protein [Eubacteriales bacterium]|nr:trypsin-like peptidase domain-containing protein [Eubacteriales bacterium]